MNHIAILAGGTGKRMGNINLPKQFISLFSIPIIIYTLRNIISTNLFDIVHVAIHPDWEEYLLQIMEQYKIDTSRVRIVKGGKERIDTVENVLDSMTASGFADDDVIVIHDGVRPFVSQRILQNSIKVAREKGAVVAVIPVKDTMVWMDDGESISHIPDRSKIFSGQAPDAFRFSILRDALKSLTPEERAVITGTSQVCKFKGIDVHTIRGDERNIKITTSMDLFIARAIIFEKGLML